MPLHVSVANDGSRFIAGLAQGNCQYFDTTKRKAMKGFFRNSILTGPNNILILFTYTTFQYFVGRYINDNKPNGNMIVYTFSGDGRDLRDISTPINVTKQECTYINGTLDSIISSQNIDVTIHVTYKIIDDVEFMTCFNMHEDV
jgi:hypothetical protein